MPLAGRLHLVDLHPNNVEACRRRFAGDPRVVCHVPNGWSVPLADAEASFLFCFDAMVHFDSDVVRAYLREARRVLAPGGRAFLHHSNYQEGHDWRQAPHSRAFMSQRLMEHYALKEGLQGLRQRVIDWGGVPRLDCLSLLARP